MRNEPRAYRGDCGLTHIITPAALTEQFHPDTPDSVILDAWRDGSDIRDWIETVPRAWHVTTMDENNQDRHVTVTAPTLRDSIESAHRAIDSGLMCLPCPNATSCPLRALVDAVEAADQR